MQLRRLAAVAILFGLASATQAQVYVNDVNLNTTVTQFEIHMCKKPFTTKDCYYADYGQKFKEGDYDVVKRQAIYDSTGTKFEKGEYVRMLNYLNATGWKRSSQRITKIGNIDVQVILFEKKE